MIARVVHDEREGKNVLVARLHKAMSVLVCPPNLEEHLIYWGQRGMACRNPNQAPKGGPGSSKQQQIHR